MNIKIALKFLLTILCFFVPFSFVKATDLPEQDFGVNVKANINVDLYSQLSLNSISVEIKEPSQVSLDIVDSQGNPRINRQIQIYINGSSLGVTITQPALTDILGHTVGYVRSSIAGSYEVCARDITDPLTIEILDCEVLYVTPVPVPAIFAEPPYNIGTKNTILWNTSGSGIYTYFTQVSTKADFSTIYANSGWIGAMGYEFTNLQNGQIYFYRVKAKNSFGGESSWSNAVFSVQDSQKPEIVLLSVSGLGDNTVEDWDPNDEIIIRMRVKDNIAIASKNFWCVLSDNSPDDCKDSESTTGDIWEVRIKLGDLEQDKNGYLLEEYTFCEEAVDSVGNVRRICNIYLYLLHTEGPLPPKKTPIDKAVDKAKEIIDETIGKIEIEDLEDITVTTVATNVTIGIGILIGSLNSIPYFIVQLVLSLLSILGFRKKGHPVGYVYDSVTKEPISQAIVRVFNKNGILVWTDVTDGNGYFRGTNLNKGTYSIKVTARDYTFPSKVVFGREDFPLENVYHGKEFSVRDEEIPNFSIPMDKVEYGAFRILFEKMISQSKLVWKSLHVILFVVGLCFGLYALYISQIWFNYLIVGIYIPALVLLIISLFGNKGKYGVVRNTKGERLQGIIVGLKEKEFGKLVSKRVTDHLGRYRFVVNRGDYTIEVLNSGIAIADYSGLESVVSKDNTVIARDIVVKKIVENGEREEVEEVLEPLSEL